MEGLSQVASKHGEQVLHTPRNDISIGRKYRRSMKCKYMYTITTRYAFCVIILTPAEYSENVQAMEHG